MKTLKRICFTLLFTGLVLSCVPESADADAELYPNAELNVDPSTDINADGTGNAGSQGGGDK